jgi:hypothetical protein
MTGSGIPRKGMAAKISQPVVKTLTVSQSFHSTLTYIISWTDPAQSFHSTLQKAELTLLDSMCKAHSKGDIVDNLNELAQFVNRGMLSKNPITFLMVLFRWPSWYHSLFHSRST